MKIDDWSYQDKKSLGSYLQWNSYCSERHRLLYIATPKVACTTIKWWFAEMEGYAEDLQKITDSGETDRDLIVHDSYKVAPNVTGLGLKDLTEAVESDSFFRFALVRNPYKRLFSAWQSKLLLREPLQVGPYIGTDFYHHPIMSVADISEAFESFLEHLAEHETPSYWDHHWTPQVDLLRPDLIRYSCLAKIEESEKLTEKLREWLGDSIPGPFDGHRSNESFIPYSPDFITERSAEIIRSLYAEDFDVFGYDAKAPLVKNIFSEEQCEVAIKAIKLIRARHQRLGERNDEIVGLNHTLAEREGQIASLSQAVAERDAQIARLSQAVVERDGQIANLSGGLEDQKNQMAAVLASRSWRLTIPLRKIRTLVNIIAATLSSHRYSSGANDPSQTLLGRMYRRLAIITSAIPLAVSFYEGSVTLAVRRVLGVIRRDGPGGVMRRVQILTGCRLTDKDFSSGSIYGSIKPLAKDFAPLVSVIVPNFNHAAFLKHRLDSVYQQTYSNIEVILLDDCSDDRSREILEEYAIKFPEKTRCYFNSKNSGGVFNQWKKGLGIAKGELIWIAESDDYCSGAFLEEMVCCFQNRGVKLSFGFTEFVGGNPPETIWALPHYLYDMDLTFDKPFIKSAHALVKAGWVTKNLIPNVSSVVFRRQDNMSILDDSEWMRMRLCGDWLFYLALIRGGLVAYNPHAVNYYRQHVNNTSINAQKENIYYQEFEIVAKRIVSMYAVDASDLKKQELLLYNHWCSQRGNDKLQEFRKLYDVGRCEPLTQNRYPNLMMATYSLAAGGGETFPIFLANELAKKGYTVTLLNCHQQPTEPGVLGMLSDQVSLLEIDRLDLVPAVCDDMAISLVHSHHAWVDMTFAMLLLNMPKVKQVITTHGMYEMMSSEQRKGLMPLLQSRIDYIVYTAEKNLSGLSEDVLHNNNYVRIDNALPTKPVSPVSRKELGIGLKDFVLCLVSRAIPDKGWAEAIEAVMRANEVSQKKIQLLIIGDGPELDRLSLLPSSQYVHLLGFRQNIRDYFAAADMGFLPSRFKGESAPLVVIDCLLAGRPVLASDIGEIRYLLETPNGLAGSVFSLDDWSINIPELSGLIVELATDPELYSSLASRVPEAAAKFDVKSMVQKYEKVYNGVLLAG